MNPDAEFISQVDELSDALCAMGKSTSGSDVGTGGMAAKLYAAKIAAGSGTDMVIANGDDVGVIWDILEGREVGTLFTAHRSPDFTLLDYIESVPPITPEQSPQAGPDHRKDRPGTDSIIEGEKQHGCRKDRQNQCPLP